MRAMHVAQMTNVMRRNAASIASVLLVLSVTVAALTQHFVSSVPRHVSTAPTHNAHSSPIATSAQSVPLIARGVATGGPAAPTGLRIQNDDHLATASWTASSDGSTVGYKVSWGPMGSLTHAFYTPYTQAQLQPLDDGKTYQVEVQGVNSTGGLSAVLGPASAQTDPTYINQLRARMNGQFDDFNTNPYGGAVDPTHWYTSFNNATPISMAFEFAAQDHLHLFLQNGDGSDRGSVTMRALHPFDFTNRTGAIAFDFDWGRSDTGRYQWYLVLSPSEVDDINYDAVSGGQHGIYPGDAFVVFMDRDQVHFRKVQGGQIVQEWTADLAQSLRTINVRKHSLLQISQNAATLSISGQTVLSVAGINLDFQRAWVYNQQFQYNLPKDGIPFALSHWDNIGFDAPVGYAPDVLHEYTDGNSVASDQRDAPASWTIMVPDELSGAKAERLFLDVNDGWNNEGAAPPVTVNGVAVPYPVEPLTDNVAHDARVITLPVGTLHTGANTISVGAAPGLNIQNVHVEVAFPAGSAAPYTPTPWTMAGMGSDPMAMIPVIGPRPAFGERSPQNGATVSGKVTVEVSADGTYALLPTGHVDAVTQLAVLIDGQPAAIYKLQAPTVTTDQVLVLDTTRLSNGVHTLAVAAYGTDTQANGAPAVLDSQNTLIHDIRTLTVAN
jgi:fibronectin type III domain protein